MSYAKQHFIEFYPCYLQQCHSIDLFSYRTPGHGQKGHMNKVCPSFCSEVFMEFALQFFSETQHGVRGPCSVVYDRKNVLSPKWGKQAKPSVLCMYRKVQFFSQLFIFFISVVSDESLYYCYFFMLEQISYLVKFWFLSDGPKCSWPIRLQDFPIIARL